MRTLVVTATSLGLIAATLLIGATLLLLGARSELDTTRSVLDTTKSELDTTKSELGEAMTQQAQLSVDLRGVEQQLSDEITVNESLIIELQTAVDQLGNERVNSRTLNSQLTSAKASLTTEISEKLDLMYANAILAVELKTVSGQLAGQIEDNQTLLIEVGQLNEVKDERDVIAAQLNSLSSQVSDLQNEITVLERRRAPLIVESYTSRIACTGSMEPKITCLDTATFLSNFKPEHIVSGAVISFTPTAECNLELDGYRVAHRVMAIKIESGIYYYWTKGDANSGFDDCWIPDTNVDGYIIELHKNTNPENAPLREKVNSAKAMWYQAQAIYDSKHLEYCGSSDAVCWLYEPYYSEISGLRAEMESLLDAYLVAIDEAKA